MKKIVSAVLLLSAVTMTFCSCYYNKNGNSTDVTQNPTTTSSIFKTDKDDFTEYYSAIDLDFGYNNLENDNQKIVYNAMKGKSSSFTDELSENGRYLSDAIVIQKEIPEEDIFIAFTAYRYDNPGDFWLSESFSSGRSNNTTVIRLSSYYSPQELVQKQSEFNSKVNDIISPLAGGISEYDLELYFHDYIIDNCQYDFDAAEYVNSDELGDKYAESFTAYGALINGRAICQGYTEAMGYLLSCVGIESSQITGKSQEGNHIWNSVKIDGDWYQLDVTWDDTDSLSSNHDYFNITTDELEYNHSVAPVFSELSAERITGGETNLGCSFNIFLPECNSKDSNYYVKSGAVLRDFDYENDALIGQSLAECAESQNEYFHIYADPDYVDFDYAVSQLFDSYIYHFQTYVDKANDILGYKCLEPSAAIVEKQRLNVITVKLTYV